MENISALFLPLMILVMYFFFIRPQMKKAKKTRIFQEQLQKGQKVVTTGGLHGKIFQADPNSPTVIVEVSGNKFKIERSAINMEASAAVESK